MESLKQEALNVISKLPDMAKIDDIMYRLYVIDKVRKGREAIKTGDTVSIEILKKDRPCEDLYGREAFLDTGCECGSGVG